MLKAKQKNIIIFCFYSLRGVGLPLRAGGQYSPADSGIFDSSPMLQCYRVLFSGTAEEL